MVADGRFGSEALRPCAAADPEIPAHPSILRSLGEAKAASPARITKPDGTPIIASDAPKLGLGHSRLTKAWHRYEFV